MDSEGRFSRETWSKSLLTTHNQTSPSPEESINSPTKLTRRSKDSTDIPNQLEPPWDHHQMPRSSDLLVSRSPPHSTGETPSPQSWVPSRTKDTVDHAGPSPLPPPSSHIGPLPPVTLRTFQNNKLPVVLPTLFTAEVPEDAVVVLPRLHSNMSSTMAVLPQSGPTPTSHTLDKITPVDWTLRPPPQSLNSNHTSTSRPTATKVWSRPSSPRDPSQSQLMPQLGTHTKEESLMVATPSTPMSTTPSNLLVTELIPSTETIGPSETLGHQLGENKDTSESEDPRPESTVVLTSPLKMAVVVMEDPHRSPSAECVVSYSITPSPWPENQPRSISFNEY